jgi:hypothetical protein
MKNSIKTLLIIALLIGTTNIDARQRLQDRNTAPLENDSNTVDLATQAQQLQDQEVALNAEQIARDEELNRLIAELGLERVMNVFAQHFGNPAND